MGDFDASHAVPVAGSIEDCFAVLVDFADYPNWSKPVMTCEVLDRHPDGLPRRVAFEVDMVKTVRYTLEYTWDRPRGARWKLVEGDLKSVEGSYVFEPAGAGRTKATCSQSVDVGFWVPGLIRRTLEQKALRDSVEEFRQAVESRSRGAGKGDRS
jgi:hypothetical protein